MPKVQPAPEPAAGRSSRGRRATSSLAEINVVPLVDVMLVLLVIFMVTAPLIQRGMDINIPVAQRAAAITGERLTVNIPAAFRQNRVVYLNNDAVRIDVLQERVRQKMEESSDKEVFLRGDAAVQYQDLMDVIDRLKAAGVAKLGMLARLPEEQ
jgi:biopolymer transport protein ExbD